MTTPGRWRRLCLALVATALAVTACADRDEAYQELQADKDAVDAQLAAANDRIAALEVDLRTAEARLSDDSAQLTAWEDFAGTTGAGEWPEAVLEAYDMGCSGNSATYAECACFTSALRDQVPLMDLLLINQLAFAAQVGTADIDPTTGYPEGMPQETIDVIERAGKDCEALGVDPIVETGNPVVTGPPLPTLPRQGADPAVGMVAPAISGEDFDGGLVEVVPGSGPTAILFLAHWCPYCQAEVPAVTAWWNEAQPAGIALVAVSSSVNPEAPNYPPSAWLEREGWPLPVILDNARGEAFVAYGGTGFPYWVFLDGTGEVVLRHAGSLPINQFEAILAELAG